MTKELMAQLMEIVATLFAKIDRVIEVLEAISRNTDELKRLANIESNTRKKVTNLKLKLPQYNNFDWGSIGAEVIETDDYGVSIVRVGPFQYERKASDDERMGKAIWFSRQNGRTADGAKPTYEELVKFTDRKHKPYKVPPNIQGIIQLNGSGPKKPNNGGGGGIKPTPPPQPINGGGKDHIPIIKEWSMQEQSKVMMYQYQDGDLVGETDIEKLGYEKYIALYKTLPPSKKAVKTMLTTGGKVANG